MEAAAGSPRRRGLAHRDKKAQEIYRYNQDETDQKDAHLRRDLFIRARFKGGFGGFLRIVRDRDLTAGWVTGEDRIHLFGFIPAGEGNAL